MKSGLEKFRGGAPQFMKSECWGEGIKKAAEQGVPRSKFDICSIQL